MPAKHPDERRPRSESGPLWSARPSTPVHSWQPLNYHKVCYRRALDRSGIGGLWRRRARSTKRGDELFERDHLAAARGGRHEDDGAHAGRAPRLDAVADLLGAAEQRHVAQPAVGHGGDVLARIARLHPVVLVVRQLDVGRERLAHDGGGGGAIGVDARGNHVADEELRIAPRALRQVAQRLRHVRACGVGPHRALGDLARERDHPAPQRGQRERRQRADLRRIALHLGRELAHVVQRPAGLDAETAMSRPVAHADTEAEAAARQLVDDRRRLRPLERVTRVDVGDAGAERDLMRDEGQRLAERHAVAGARTVDAGEAFRLEALREIERRPPPSGDSDEADGGFCAHRSPLQSDMNGRRPYTCRLTAPDTSHPAPRSDSETTSPRVSVGGAAAETPGSVRRYWIVSVSPTLRCSTPIGATDLPSYSRAPTL